MLKKFALNEEKGDGMKTLRKVIKAITIIAGVLLILAISGYDSGSALNTGLIVICTTWILTILLINYKEVVNKYD